MGLPSVKSSRVNTARFNSNAFIHRVPKSSTLTTLSHIMVGVDTNYQTSFIHHIKTPGVYKTQGGFSTVEISCNAVVSKAIIQGAGFCNSIEEVDTNYQTSCIHHIKTPGTYKARGDFSTMEISCNLVVSKTIMQGAGFYNSIEEVDTNYQTSCIHHIKRLEAI